MVLPAVSLPVAGWRGLASERGAVLQLVVSQRERVEQARATSRAVVGPWPTLGPFQTYQVQTYQAST
jgi:hypothetical protein